ncbi:uncharacterized protein METZ01_LOCUS472631, partial [marine metagenome]
MIQYSVLKAAFSLFRNPLIPFLFQAIGILDKALSLAEGPE